MRNQLSSTSYSRNYTDLLLRVISLLLKKKEGFCSVAQADLRFATSHFCLPPNASSISVGHYDTFQRLIQGCIYSILMLQITSKIKFLKMTFNPSVIAFEGKLSRNLKSMFLSDKSQ